MTPEEVKHSFEELDLYTIHSLHINFDDDVLIINGKKYDGDILVIMPGTMPVKNNWIRKKWFNLGCRSKEEYIEAKTRGERVPCLELTFTEGTGRYKFDSTGMYREDKNV